MNSDLGTGASGPTQEYKGGRAPPRERTIVLPGSGTRRVGRDGGRGVRYFGTRQTHHS